MCFGVWLDKGELEQIQETIEYDYSASALPDDIAAAYAAAKVKQEDTYKCPICGEELIKKEYAFCSQIYIDTCPNDHGMWLHKGELAQLEIFFEREILKQKQEIAAEEAAEEEVKKNKGFFKSFLAMFK